MNSCLTKDGETHGTWMPFVSTYTDVVGGYSKIVLNIHHGRQGLERSVFNSILNLKLGRHQKPTSK